MPAGPPDVLSGEEDEDTDTDAELDEPQAQGRSSARPPVAINGAVNGLGSAQPGASARHQKPSRRTPSQQQGSAHGAGWQQASHGDDNFCRHTPSQHRPAGALPAAPNDTYVPPHVAGSRSGQARAQHQRQSNGVLGGDSSGGFNQAHLAALSSAHAAAAHAAAELTLRASGIPSRLALNGMAPASRHASAPSSTSHRAESGASSPFMSAAAQSERGGLQTVPGQQQAFQVPVAGPGLAYGPRREDVQHAGLQPPPPAWQHASLPPLPGRSPPWAGVPGPQAVPRPSPPLLPGHAVPIVGPPPLTLPPSMHYPAGSAADEVMTLGHQHPAALANGHLELSNGAGGNLPTSTDSSIMSLVAGTPMTSDSGSHLSSTESPRWASASSAELMSSYSPRSSQPAGGSLGGFGPARGSARDRALGPVAGDDNHDLDPDQEALQKDYQSDVPTARLRAQQQQQQQQGGEGGRRHSADLPPRDQQRGGRREADGRDRLDLRMHRSADGDRVRGWCRPFAFKTS